jgi:hypothetical protein
LLQGTKALNGARKEEEVLAPWQSTIQVRLLSTEHFAKNFFILPSREKYLHHQSWKNICSKQSD